MGILGEGASSARALAWCAVVALAACGDAANDSRADAATTHDADVADAAVADATPDYSNRPARVGPIAAETQREGDAEAGYDVLVNYGLVTCGIPISAYRQVFGTAPAGQRLPGRTGLNADLPYAFTATRTARGVDVIAANCLTCHAGAVNGQFVIGLGNADSDYTQSFAAAAVLGRGFVDQDNPDELFEFDRWAERVRAVAPQVALDTVGVNPADNLAATLFAYRDRDTLAWLGRPQYTLPRTVVPLDVPAWWHMRKKNAMFYTGAGRGDHARIMMSASTLCSDTVEEAREIDQHLPDLLAYVRSLEAPPYPFEVDATAAQAGKALFEDHCERCHGSYGERDEYPNLVVALADVGTDPTLALGAALYSDEFLAWFNESFWGELARLEPALGYVAPPLDGIWASGPYFHNASVPTLAGVLDPAARPAYWVRTLGERRYDEAAVGPVHRESPVGKDGASDARERALIYDTTREGYGNRGHTYAAGFTDGERAALLEYLKTL